MKFIYHYCHCSEIKYNANISIITVLLYNLLWNSVTDAFNLLSELCVGVSSDSRWITACLVVLITSIWEE